LNFTPKKWMKFATKGDPRLTPKSGWSLHPREIPDSPKKMNEVCWQTSEVRLTQNVDEVCNRFLLSSFRTRKTQEIFYLKTMKSTCMIILMGRMNLGLESRLGLV
jgi:hypothetical protein